jgi:hypothetical protein
MVKTGDQHTPTLEFLPVLRQQKDQKLDGHHRVAAAATNIWSLSCFFRFLSSFLRTLLMMTCFFAILCSCLPLLTISCFFCFILLTFDKRWVTLSFRSSFSALTCLSSTRYSCNFSFSLLFLLYNFVTSGFKVRLEESWQ